MTIPILLGAGLPPSSPFLMSPPSMPMLSPPSPPEYSAGSTVVGIIMALIAAAGIGISMVVQRYGLANSEARVPVLCCTATRFQAWFLGLILYGISNGLQAFSLTLGPLFLLGGVFTLLLIFNMFFAWLILGEQITRFKMAGGVMVVLGVTLSIIAAPSDTKTNYSGDEIADRFASASAYVVLLFGALACSALVMTLFERRYPTSDSLAARHAAAASLKNDPEQGRSAPAADKPPAELRLAPPHLERWMGILYPLSLGLDEVSSQPDGGGGTPYAAVHNPRSLVPAHLSYLPCPPSPQGSAQLTLRSWLLVVSDDRPDSSINHWTFFTCLSLWVFFSLATVPCAPIAAVCHSPPRPAPLPAASSSVAAHAAPERTLTSRGLNRARDLCGRHAGRLPPIRDYSRASHRIRHRQCGRRLLGPNLL